MAIIFSKEPVETLKNAYNNSVLEFTSDVGTCSRATIIVDGYTFEITPNKNQFYFNLKEIVKVLVNQNNFKDEIEVSNPSNYLFPDANLFKEINFEISVFKKDSSSEEIEKTYQYLKSVKQIFRSKFTENDLLQILSPSNDIVKYITYFEGYPFDISIYSNISRTITLTHQGNQNTTTLNLSKGVNRLFISNGENDNLGFESIIPLAIGLNELELQVDANNKLSLFITKKEVDCGTYLKFFNQNGSWSYWKCSPIFRENLKVNSLDELNSDFYNLEDTNSRINQTGKLAEKGLDLKTNLMNEKERLIVEQIFTSPKVFCYNNLELQPFSLFDWIEVKVADTSKELKNSKNAPKEYDLKIELPELYTQTYGG